MESGKRAVKARRAGAAVAVGVVVAALLIALAASLQRPPTHRRFVSKSLPDGTRYTLLVPAGFDTFAEKSVSPAGWRPGSPQYLSTAGATNWGGPGAALWQRAVYRLGLPLAWAARADAKESLHVAVIKLRRPQAGDSRRQSDRVFASRRRRNVQIVDARTKTLFYLNYDAFAAAPPDRFARHRALIAGSFRVLPPGVPPPR